MQREFACAEEKFQKQQWAQKTRKCFKSCGAKSWALKLSATGIKGTSEPVDLLTMHTVCTQEGTGQDIKWS